MKPGDLFKIRYQPGERGWAKYISDGIAAIENNALAGNVSVGDIVAFKTCGGDFEVTRVLAKRHPKTTLVEYQKEYQYHQLSDMLAIVGCESEGFVEPMNGKSGVMAVAGPENVDPRMVAAAVGIPQKKE